MADDFKINTADFKGTRLEMSDKAEYIGRGGQGAILRDEGTIIKIHYNDGEQLHQINPSPLASISSEAATLGLMSEHNRSGLQIPRPIEFFHFGQPVFSEGRGYAGALRMTELDGQTPDWDTLRAKPEVLDQHLFDAGYVMGTLHTAARSIPEASLAPYTSRATEFFASAARGPSQFVSEKEIEVLRKLQAQREARNEPQLLLHMDLYPTNMMVDKNNRVTGVIDWGAARVGPREDDFFHYSCDFLRLGQPVDKTLNRVLDGYQAATGDRPDLESIRLSTMLNLGWRIMGRERAGQMDPDAQKYLVEPFKELIKPHMPAEEPATTRRPSPVLGMR